MTIRAYDLDGCLFDFNRSMVDLINTTYGKDLPLPSATWPDCWQWLRKAGVTRKEEDALWETVRNTEFWFNLLPLPGAIEAASLIEYQRLNGDHVYFITARPGKFAKLYSEWALRNLGISLPTVIIANDGKGPLAVALELEFFVDDKPQNCAEVKASVPGCQVFLVTRPYQADWTDPGVISIPSVLDAINYQETEVTA